MIYHWAKWYQTRPILGQTLSRPRYGGFLRRWAGMLQTPIGPCGE